MTIENWLNAAVKTLTDASISTGRLDCLVLLEDCLKKDRAHVLAHPATELTHEQEKVLNSQIERRAKHEPLAYIRGKTEFYGREFMVNAHTLEPRPETETMVELLKKLKLNKPIMCDVGTGSGAIAITTALEMPGSKVYACDISDECLQVATHNSKHHKASITIFKSNLLNPVRNTYEVLLCNLPYVPNAHTINEAAMFEPKIAIFGGPDGLDLYRKLFKQITAQDWKPTYILTESLPFQHENLATIAKEHGYQCTQTDDFIQVFTLAR